MRLSDSLTRLWQPASVTSMLSMAVVLLVLSGTPSNLLAQEIDSPLPASDAAQAGAEEAAAPPPEGDGEVPDGPTSPLPSDQRADQVLEREGKVGDSGGSFGSDEEARLRFNFSATPWGEVLEWLVDEADLSLRADRYPPGSLTFQDPSRTYTPSEALDQLNRLLLDRGFALVRRGRLLIVIDLEDPSAEKYIENIAEVVTPAQLDGRGESDIVKCIFPLGAMSPEAAEDELAQMVGPGMPMTVLPSARQVVITDTVARLKAIRTVLEDAERAGSDVVEIPLQHRSAEEILLLARSLLELEDGQNSNDEIRIAVDPFGDRLYAVGNPAMISLLKRVVERADQTLEAADGAVVEETQLPELRSYPIAIADPSTVFDVLQTLLAGLPDTRLTIDPESNAVIAFARPETHAKIQATLDHLEGTGKQLEVIQLRRLEPSAALLTINKFFGKTEDGNEGPTVDGDPITSRLWVHGTPDQIAKTKDLIEQLEDSDSAGPLGDRVRILPFTGQDASATLEQVRMLWEVSGRNTRIRLVTPSASQETRQGFPQRSLQSRRSKASNVPESSDEVDSAADARDSESDRRPTSDVSFPEASHQASDSPYQLVTQQLPPESEGDDAAAADAADGNVERGEQESPFPRSPNEVPSPSDKREPGEIVISMTPQGMIIVGDDPVALAEFEELVRTVAEQSALGGAQPTVFWLKFVKASVASQLINGVLGGTDSSGDGLSDMAGGLLDELGGGMLGGLMGLGGGGGGGGSDGPILTATGSVSIIPDDRLNALIIQANAVDMQLIEKILEVVDREESPEEVQTQARPRLIPVIYQDAQAVAEIVKSIFADKIAQPAGSGRGGNDRQPSPQELIAALRGGGGRGGRGGGGGDGQGEKSEPQKITVAVDQRSNAIIVTATPNDYEQIVELVEAIDQGGMENEETVQVVQLNGAINPQVVQTALQSVLGAQAKTASSGAPAPSSTSSTPSSSDGEQRASSDASEIQRRIEMFRAMRGGGTTGGGRGGFSGRGGGGERGGRGSRGGR